MAGRFRSLVSSGVLQCWRELAVAQISKKLVLNNLSNSSCELTLPFAALFGSNKVEVSSVSQLVQSFPTCDTINGVFSTPPGAKNGKVTFKINKEDFIQEVLSRTFAKEWWKDSEIFSYSREKVIVEFSSPNVAKPFHVGHLRSTIIGSFIANLLSAAGHDIMRLNYLGDWGTQFGFLQVGLEMNWYTWEEIEKDPINVLLDIYVRSNQLAAKDETVALKARECFNLLESGSPTHRAVWERIREFTIAELEKVYAEIGIRFDDFHGESMYSISDIKNVIDRLKNKGILQQDEDGKWVVQLPERSVTVVKSDGSSLYISRDIAAALDRFRRYGFDRMIYIVDTAQSDHFQSLKSILRLMGETFEGRMEHVKFGRIQGMSTRKGTAVYLKDVLEEARELVRQKQLDTLTTKVNVDRDPQVTAVLASSAVIINDLKQRRQSNYVFDWDKALQQKGDSGIRLQYTYARLCSLKENCGVQLGEPDFAHVGEILGEPQALQLVLDIAKFDEVLKDSYEQLEPCILVNYLFKLSHSISGALKVLPVKGQEKPVGEARLALFHAAHETLDSGMRIVGLQPLEKM